MGNNSDDDKIDEIFNKVIDVVKHCAPTDGCNALSKAMAYILALYCVHKGVDYKPLLKDLTDDIKNLTELYIASYKDGLINLEM